MNVIFDEMKHISLHSLADNAIVKFTTVAQMSAFCSNMLMPLVDCIDNDALVHAMPNMQQTLLQFVNAVQLQLMHSLLDNTTHLVIHQCYSAVTDWEE